jgi:hypothetical protein
MPKKRQPSQSRRISAARLKQAGSLLLKRLRGLPGRCSGRMEKRRFRNALRDVGVKNIEDYIDWAERRGGMCDCEVVLNAMTGYL